MTEQSFKTYKELYEYMNFLECLHSDINITGKQREELENLSDAAKRFTRLVIDEELFDKASSLQMDIIDLRKFLHVAQDGADLVLMADNGKGLRPVYYALIAERENIIRGLKEKLEKKEREFEEL